MFSGLYGVVNWVTARAGMDSIEFVSRYPLGSIVVVLVWQWTPFMMLIMLAGLQSQPAEVLEAAKVDGASAFGTFRQLTLPHLRPYMELGTLLGTIYLIQVFDQVAVMTGGGPDSTNIPYFVYQRSIGGGWEFGKASAYSHRRRRRLDRRRHHRPARAVASAARGGDRLMAGSAGAQLGVGERRSVNAADGRRRLARRPAVLLPRLLDGRSTRSRRSRTPTPAPSCSSAPRSIATATSPESTHRPAVVPRGVHQLVLGRGRQHRWSCSCWRSPRPTPSPIRPVPKWRDVLFFFISTKFLPVVASILPLWILARNFDLLNTRLVLMILYTGMNLPLAVWMLRSFFQEIPRELIEAAEIDGAGLRGQLASVILPIAAPGHRRHGAAVRDLRLERVLLRRPAQSGRRLDDPDLGHDEHQHPW